MPTQVNDRRLLAPLATCLLALGASSCLVGKTENTQYSGRFIGEETLKQIEPGDDAGEVESLLGQPSTKTEKSTGSTIWKYAYTKAKTESGAVFLLFGSSKTTQTEGAVYVEFGQDGKVIKTWSER